MKQQKQSGFAHLGIVAIALTIIIVGALGFVFYQNFVQKKDTSKVSVLKSNTDSAIDAKDLTPVTDNSNAVSNDGYLVLDDWNVKLKLPSNLGDNQITYHKDSGVLPGSTDELYGFSTKRVELMGGRCVNATSEGPVVYLAELIRTKQADRDDGEYTRLAAHIGDYYYYTFNNGSPCSEKGDEFQYADRIMLKDFLLSVEKE